MVSAGRLANATSRTAFLSISFSLACPHDCGTAVVPQPCRTLDALVVAVARPGWAPAEREQILAVARRDQVGNTVRNGLSYPRQWVRQGHVERHVGAEHDAISANPRDQVRERRHVVSYHV